MSVLNLLPILITGFGLYFLIKLRFFFVIHPLKTARKLKFLVKDKSSRHSLSLALAGTLGVGNIVGVAYGITVGGAGSVFWILVSAVFAAVIKFAESLLAADRRTDGRGGMMYVVLDSFGKAGRAMGTIYAMLCLMLSLTMGAALQSKSALDSAGLSLKLNPVILSVFFTAAVIATVFGGYSKIEKATAVLIPIATVVYVCICISVIVFNASRLCEVLSRIMREAMTFKSASGGVSAFFVSGAIKEGFARGLLSNEAGAGTSSMAQARSDASHPAAVGLLGMCEVFFDTVLLCMLTGFAVLLALPENMLSGSGMALVINAAASVLGKGSGPVLSLLVFAFAYSTVVCWYFYGCESLKFIFGKSSNAVYISLFIISVFCGFLIPEGVLIGCSDYVLLFMSIITLLTLLKNSERIGFLSEQYGLFKLKESYRGKRGVSQR